MRYLTFVCSFSVLTSTFVLNNGSVNAEHPTVTELREAQEVAEWERAQGWEQREGTMNENACSGIPKSNRESGDNVDSRMDLR